MRTAIIEIRYKDHNGETVVYQPPIKLKEVPVRGIVNNEERNKMQRVRFKINKDGTLEWDKKATPDIIRIGNAMARTRTGLAQLRKMDEAKYPIYLSFGTSNIKNVDEDTGKIYEASNVLGKTEHDIHTGRYTGGSDVVMLARVFNGAIDTLIKEAQSGKFSSSNSRRQALLEGFAKLDEKEAILGAVGGHEAEHTTVPNIELTLEWKTKCKVDPNLEKNTPYEQIPMEIQPHKVELVILEEEYDMLSAAEKIVVDELEQQILNAFHNKQQ